VSDYIPDSETSVIFKKIVKDDGPEDFMNFTGPEIFRSYYISFSCYQKILINTLDIEEENSLYR
jgi:hypothetical protein